MEEVRTCLEEAYERMRPLTKTELKKSKSLYDLKTMRISGWGERIKDSKNRRKAVEKSKKNENP